MLPVSPTRSMDANIGGFVSDSKIVPPAGYTELVQKQLAMLGEDPGREGLQRTPERVAKAMAYLTRGYKDDVRSIVGQGVFEEDHENMVMVRDIELYSMCRSEERRV